MHIPVTCLPGLIGIPADQTLLVEYAIVFAALLNEMSNAVQPRIVDIVKGVYAMSGGGEFISRQYMEYTFSSNGWKVFPRVILVK